MTGEIDSLVRRHFYAPDRLGDLGWSAAVSRANAAMAEARDGAGRTAAVREMLATLATSHTAYYPRDDPAYWELMAIYERPIERECAAARRPPLPIEIFSAGVFWKELGGSWFVGGVYPGGPADAAGLRLGDEVVSAGGGPFSPVRALESGKPVRLEVRGAAGGPTRPVDLVPRSMRPVEALRQASADSWRMIERGSRRIAYLRVWSWAGLEVQAVVIDAIRKANLERADGFILDIRDGWGGADPSYLGIFGREIPILESVDRDGARTPFDAQIRVPAVILVNGGTRSGKELIAYGAKKHRLARLVGERTGGAVVFGRPFCLADGSLLYLAVADARVDGERLEGVGVEPDVAVPFDIRHAGGADPQLERALEILSAP